VSVVNPQSVTPLVLTFNEEANIARTLQGLAWARQIVVVDSGSTDATLEILSNCAAVRLEHRTFDDFASQCNFGLKFVTTPWVLSLDADYQCPPEFETELISLNEDVSGFEYSFVYCIHGHPLRGSLYPPRVVLFRKELGQYVSDGHAHRLNLQGPVKKVITRILHDDRKPLARWLEWQDKYADLEVQKIFSTPSHLLSWKDRLRKKIVCAPIFTLAYCLFGKGLILDGWPGVYYTLQRVYAELLLSLKLLDARSTPRGDKEHGGGVHHPPTIQSTETSTDLVCESIVADGSCPNCGPLSHS
jgi:glycosyltransferase involved in cell wall biosynthesis